MRDDMRGKVGMRMKTGSTWLTGAPLAANHDRGLGPGGHTPTVCCPGRDRDSPLPPPLPVSGSPQQKAHCGMSVFSRSCPAGPGHLQLGGRSAWSEARKQGWRVLRPTPHPSAPGVVVWAAPVLALGSVLSFPRGPSWGLFWTVLRG